MNLMEKHFRKVNKKKVVKDFDRPIADVLFDKYLKEGSFRYDQDVDGTVTAIFECECAMSGDGLFFSIDEDGHWVDKMELWIDEESKQINDYMTKKAEALVESDEIREEIEYKKNHIY